nr:hypothetical protein [Klebsiella pneumoniae subsp. pneumoniae]
MIGPVADQQTIKPGGFMGLRKANDIVAVKDRPHRGNRFGREAVANHAEKLNAHEQLLRQGNGVAATAALVITLYRAC